MGKEFNIYFALNNTEEICTIRYVKEIKVLITDFTKTVM